MSKFLEIPPERPGDLPFHIPLIYQNYNLVKSSAENHGYVKIFNSPNKSQSIVIKKFTNPFDAVEVAKLVLREINLLRTVRHENIVKLIGCYAMEKSANDLNTIYHVTEFCGRELSEIIEEGKYSLNFVKKWTIEMLLGTQHLHSHGVILRNLNPSNLCIDANNKLTVIGFGQARTVDRDNTMTQLAVSTTYTPIEVQCKWSRPYDEKVDIWSIACVLCELITGTAIFYHEKGHALLKQIEFCGNIQNAELDMMTEPNEKRPLIAYMTQKPSVRKNLIAVLDSMMTTERDIKKADLEQQQYPLKDFLDHTLLFCAANRLSADHALSHQFLMAPQPWERQLQKDPTQALKELRGHIWEEIKLVSVFE